MIIALPICGYGGIGRHAGFRSCHLSEGFFTRANLKIKYAGMVELVDSEDLGSSAKWRVGSSPTTRTKKGLNQL